jgi:hypothetical protein
VIFPYIHLMCFFLKFIDRDTLIMLSLHLSPDLVRCIIIEIIVELPFIFYANSHLIYNIYF